MADHDPPMWDRRGLRVLSTTQCLDRIREQVMGRVAFVHGTEVLILPVNHLVVDERITFRTSWGSKLQVAADAGPMSFEVDGHDVSRSWGWSVLAQGQAAIVRDPEERDRLDGRTPVTWAPAAENMFWVVITPTRVTGREIDSEPPPTGDARDLRP